MAALLSRLAGASMLSVSFAAASMAQEIAVFSNQPETAPFIAVLKELTEDYAAENPGASWSHEMAAAGTTMQRLQILAASDALPLLITHPDQPALNDLYSSGRVINIMDKLEELDLLQYVDPLMVQRIQLVEDEGADVMYQLPVTRVIEGIYYNRALFEQAGITEEPTSWDEFLQACQQLDAAGIQPIVASGNTGWALLRLLGMYAQRKLGDDAMERVRDGELSLDDAGFVEAAQAIKDLATAGYFGPAYVNMQFAEHIDTFAQQRAAMTFLPSSTLAQLQDPQISSIAPQDLGFFNFPTVPDGVSSGEAWMVGAGLTFSITTTAYNRDPEGVDAWLSYVVPRYGARAREIGLMSALASDNPDIVISPLMSFMEGQLDELSAAVGTYERYFNSEAFAVSQFDAALFMSTDMSAEAFTEKVFLANQD